MPPIVLTLFSVDPCQIRHIVQLHVDWEGIACFSLSCAGIVVGEKFDKPFAAAYESEIVRSPCTICLKFPAYFGGTPLAQLSAGFV